MGLLLLQYPHLGPPSLSPKLLQANSAKSEQNGVPVCMNMCEGDGDRHGGHRVVEGGRRSPVQGVSGLILTRLS